jgi:hypothetical protein
LKTIKGDAGNLEVLEEVADIAKGYKDGDIKFTATINAVLDPELVSKEEPAADLQDAIDVEAEVA